ncbi:hypothetical protein VKT23_018179 [Stygiomarasmius scandens]|uniref:Protein kinase domain-containing protein n=1 Tax=Marasmiellus scandens TaxID=2682957 RepID=A0ABR1IUD3_9AGAR
MSVPEDTLEFTDEEEQKAMLFMEAACDLCVDKDSRRLELHEVLDGFHSHSSVRYTNAQKARCFTPDGTKYVQCSGVKVYPTFQEVKNEIGTGRSDPIAQCECDYVAAVTSEEYLPIRRASCCPSLLVGIAGPNLTVSGAVFTENQLVSQRLIDYIYLGPIPSDGTCSPHVKGHRRIAPQFLRAFKTAVERLCTFYEGLRPQYLENRRHFVCSPHFDTYTVGQDNFRITYLERLCPESATKTIFRAKVRTLASGETCQVAVKFTHSYDKEAHELLASHGLAPALKYCERVSSVRGMFVVVMDWVTGQPFSMQNDAAVIPFLRMAVKKLHEDGRVFGDLRESNVLVEQSENTVSFSLVDFDWRGGENSARYPRFINLDSAIGWPPDVRPGGLITKAHDAHMFKKLTGMELDG